MKKIPFPNWFIERGNKSKTYKKKDYEKFIEEREKEFKEQIKKYVKRKCWITRYEKMNVKYMGSLRQDIKESRLVWWDREDIKELIKRTLLLNKNTKQTIKVYPLGVISKPYNFCDIISKKYGHIACVISLSTKEAKKEGVVWDNDGYPDIYVKDKKITFEAIQKGLNLLEKDPKNKHKYKLIKKNYMETIWTSKKSKNGFTKSMKKKTRQK